MKRLLLLFALAGAVLVVLPSTASAQIPAESWQNDRCDDQSGPTSNGPLRTDDQFNNLIVAVSGSGSVAAAMHGTGAQECLNPMGAVCPPSCSMTVSTVCEFHCYHDHTAPYPWWVKLEPMGANFLGWTPATACNWGKTVARSWCVVRMLTDQQVTATFGAAPDTQAPAAPNLSGQRAGPFSVNLSWTASSDNVGVAGYDVYQGSTLVDRVGVATSSYKVENLRCQTTYSFRVEAFDAAGLGASSGQFSARTDACPGGGARGTVPNTVIHVKPPRVTRSRTAFFHFGARSGVVATRYQCKLDRGRWRRCSGRLGKRYRNLSRGYHTFQVRAGNGNGFDRTPSRWRWRIR